MTFIERSTGSLAVLCILASVHASVSQREFTCNGLREGFYADHLNKCKVFHQCKNGVQYSFVCPRGTMFNEDISVCDWKSNVICEPRRHKKYVQARDPKAMESYPRGGKHGPGAESQYHVHIIRDKKHSKNHQPLTLVLDEGKHKDTLPDTIVYHHDPKKEKHLPDTIVLNSGHKKQPAIRTETYEYKTNSKKKTDPPEYLILHDNTKEEKKCNCKDDKATSISNPIIIIDGNDDQYHDTGYTPDIEAYFSEDEFERIRDFFKFPDSYKKHRRPSHSSHIYDRHLHNLSRYSKNPDVVANLPKRKKPKHSHSYGHRQRPLDYDEPYFDVYDYEEREVTTPPPVVTLATVRPRNGVTEEDAETIPQLSPTDIMSSLFLQSLLVKAMDQNILGGSSTVPTLAALKTTSKKSAAKLVESLSDAKQSNKQNAYRYRSFSTNTTPNPDAELIKLNSVNRTSDAFMNMFMRLIANSTVMISRDPMLMVMNGQASAQQVANQTKPVNSTVHHDYLTTRLNSTRLYGFNSSSTYNFTNGHHASHRTDYSPLRNLEIHVHVHTGKPKVHVGSIPLNKYTPYPPLKSNTVYPPLKSNTIYPPLQSNTAYPPLQSNTVYPPLKSNTIYPPLQSNTVYPPLKSSQTYIQATHLPSSSHIHPITQHPGGKSLYHLTPPSQNYMLNRPRITFLPPIKAQSAAPKPLYQKVNPTLPHETFNHRQTKFEVPSVKETNPDTYRIRIPEGTTKVPIEYDIIVSRKPPVIDGEVIRNFSPISKANSQYPQQIRSTNSDIDENHDAREPSRPHSGISYRTIKPVQSVMEHLQESHSPISVKPSFLTDVKTENKPQNIPSQPGFGRQLQHTFLADSQTPDLPSSSHPFVIPRYYEHLNGNLRALSAFSSLPDMFVSSYSVPLPIQPHMKSPPS